jgi:hypothetical protein
VLGAVLGLLVLAVAGALLWWRSPARNAVFPPASLPATPSNSPAVSAVSPQPRASAETNDFAIMPYKLEPIPGSSLVYVTGAVSNLSDRQRFGVKLVFSLFDTNGEPAGTATDYQSLMEPRSQWRFKAMVMASKTASARFSSIAEEK